MIKRGVSLYSYQQAQFFKELDVWEQIREVREGLGTDGIEIISEQTIKGYPFPCDAWTDKWFETMEEYQMRAVTYDPHIDVLQFRDHIMDYDEAADRLKRDLRLAKKLGFQIVRTHSSHKMEIMKKALPLAEELGIPMALEVHAPMSLHGPEVTEILEYIEKTGTKFLGIVPDFSIFQVRIQKPVADWYIRRGCAPETVDFAQKICDDHVLDQIDDRLRSFQSMDSYNAYVLDGVEKEGPPGLFDKIREYIELIKKHVPNPTPLDWDLFGWPLKMPHCTGRELEEMAPHVLSCHGKFYDMTEIPGCPGQYEDVSIDYKTPVEALKRGGFQGYINSENEGQRHYQDMTKEFYSDDIEQCRRHHEMLKRLIGEE